MSSLFLSHTDAAGQGATQNCRSKVNALMFPVLEKRKQARKG